MAKRASVLWDGGAGWIVTGQGLEYPERAYCIAKGRLWEGEPDRSWLEHVTAKKWVDASNFYTAWRKAKQLHAEHRPKVAA